MQAPCPQGGQPIAEPWMSRFCSLGSIGAIADAGPYAAGKT